MPKYIDFDALGVQSCNPDVFVNKGYAEGWNSLIKILHDAPAADVEPVRHGYWIERGNGRDPYCSECCGIGDRSPFCKHCGAKMDKEEEDG